MTTRILVADGPGERWVATEIDGAVTAIAIERGPPDPTGAVFRAPVTAVDAAIGGSFVALSGLGEAFLDGTRSPVGTMLTVQVLRAAARGKPMAVTTRVEVPGQFLVARLADREVALARALPQAERTRLRAIIAEHARPGEGWMVRSAATGASAAEIAAELERLRAATADWSSGPARRVRAAPDALSRVLIPGVEVVVDYGPTAAALRAAGHSVSLVADVFRLLDPVVEAGLAPVVPLANGAALTIEPTAALVAIDVDRGRAGGSAAEVNQAALQRVFRELNLRRLGGLVLVDVLRQPDPAAMLALARRLAPPGGQVLGLTRGGLLEVQLPQPGRSLAADLAGPAAAAAAAMRAWRSAGPRATLEIASDLEAALRAVLPAVRERSGIEPVWRIAPLDRGRWVVVEPAR